MSQSDTGRGNGDAARIIGHIRELGEELDVEDEDIDAAIDIVNQYAERGLHTGKSKWGIAAAAINHATHGTEREVHKSTVAETAGVSPTTVRKRVHEFDNMDEVEPGRSDRIPDSELIGEMRRLAEERGGRPSMGDMKRIGKYSPHTYQERFGNWTEALEAADVDTRRVRVDRLISDLQRVGEKVGHVPDVSDAGLHGIYSPMMLIRECDGWENALEAAGFDPNDLPEDSMVYDLRRVYAKVNRFPVRADMREHGTNDPELYEEYYGGWRKAVDSILDEELMDEMFIDLRRLHVRLGHKPSKEELDEYGEYTADDYETLFGNWREAVDLVISDDVVEMVAVLERVGEELGHRPFRKEFDVTVEEMDLPEYSAQQYINFFGGWEIALDLILPNLNEESGED